MAQEITRQRAKDTTKEINHKTKKETTTERDI